MSSSTALDIPYVEVICGYPTRETLCCECPALLCLLYEHVVAELQNGRRPRDPFRGTSRQDHVSELLMAESVSDITDRLYSTSPSATARVPSPMREDTRVSSPDSVTFWQQLRRAVEASWTAAYNPEARALLTEVRDSPHFQFTDRQEGHPLGDGYPLHPVSLERALSTSKRFLRTASTCALDGSTDALEGQQPELRAVLQLARLVPHTVPSKSKAALAVREVTPEGLHFCMVSLQQRWWALLNAALERALILARNDGANVTKPQLWQLLAVLAQLDTAQYMYAFPDKQRDLAGHHLLARLSEVGLVYPVLSEERRCFVLSPDFMHALHWHAAAPLSLTFTQQLLRNRASNAAAGTADGGGGGISDVRREDVDTVITETNFRLYAYTTDADLLNILNQFAALEEVVNESLHCYRVTRDTFASAMRKGITATQVLRFLSLRAHPSMLARYEQRPDTTSPAKDAADRSHSGSGGAALADTVATLVVPQSFCDQVRMWESECRRVVFEHHLTLLRNISAEQQQALIQFLTEAGEADAIVHTEPGYLALREEVYDRLVAPLLE